ncbi:MAG: methylglyoxal synthase [Clostridia bacterium]|nr:methylglyoxal synthase [Clostridia bacterium]
MEIAIIAHDSKKELIAQFCIAYCGILSKHNISATSITGKYISDATGLSIERLLSGKQGGVQQITSRIAYDEIDMVVFFRSTNQSGMSNPEQEELEANLIRMCDLHNVPIATNIATAEALISALDRGDFDWREIINPKSDYNRRKKAQRY